MRQAWQEDQGGPVHRQGILQLCPSTDSFHSLPLHLCLPSLPFLADSTSLPLSCLTFPPSLLVVLLSFSSSLPPPPPPSLSFYNSSVFLLQTLKFKQVSIGSAETYFTHCRLTISF